MLNVAFTNNEKLLNNAMIGSVTTEGMSSIVLTSEEQISILPFRFRKAYCADILCILPLAFLD